MTGKDIKQHDRTLMEHELLEMKIKRENPDMEHWKAHQIASEKYDYPKETIEYYGIETTSQKWPVVFLYPFLRKRGSEMKFEEALKAMKAGSKAKLPSWGGYWYWSPEKETIIMHTKDGQELDIRETQSVVYTLQNILSDEWIIADEVNCPQLGGEATFSFGEAIKYLKRGSKVARKGWNGKKQYIQLATGISYKAADGEVVNCEHNAIGNMAVAFVGTSGVQMGWLASQADMLAEDWIFVE